MSIFSCLNNENYSDLKVEFHTKIVNTIKERDKKIEQLIKDYIKMNQNYLDESIYD